MNTVSPTVLLTSYTLFDHLHNILHESEAAPRLPGTPIARNLPLARKPVHTAPVNDGAACWPSVDGRAARDFSITRKGGDEFRDECILLVPEAKAAVACTAPNEDVPATWVSVGSCRVRPRWREWDKIGRTRSNRPQGCAVDQRRFGLPFDHSDPLRELTEEESDA